MTEELIVISIPAYNEEKTLPFVLGEIKKFGELEKFPDPEFPDNHFQTWVDLKKLPKINVKPKNLTRRILQDYKREFPEGAVYLKTIE